MDIPGANTTTNTSFIPKKPMVPKGGFNTSFSGIFLAISIIVFAVSVGGYFWAVWQEKVKTQEVADLRVILEQAQAQFQPNQVINMTRFDMKMKVAKDLLYLDKAPSASDNVMHITLQPLLKLLSDRTLKSIRFRDFKYSNVDNQKIDIKMNGEVRGGGSTANYAAVAQQAREFSDTRMLTNVIVSDLNLGANNSVVFNLSASVKPELISYTEYLKQ